jgi:hypothetical protein
MEIHVAWVEYASYSSAGGFSVSFGVSTEYQARGLKSTFPQFPAALAAVGQWHHFER